MTNLIFIVDLVLNFRTGFLDIKERTIVLDPKAIAVRYVRTWFVVDLIAAMLHPDPERRLSSEDCLQHRIFSAGNNRAAPDARTDIASLLDIPPYLTPKELESALNDEIRHASAALSVC